MYPQSWEGTHEYGVLEDWCCTSSYIIGLTPALPDLALVQDDNILIEADGKETGQTDPSSTWGLPILFPLKNHKLSSQIRQTKWKHFSCFNVCISLGIKYFLIFSANISEDICIIGSEGVDSVWLWIIHTQVAPLVTRNKGTHPHLSLQKHFADSQRNSTLIFLFCCCLKLSPDLPQFCKINGLWQLYYIY